MTLFLSQLINGLHVGIIYALIALGYTMVYGIVKLINFAHGDIIMIGAYTAVITLSTLGWSAPVALLAAIALCVLFGITIERIAYKPLRSSPRISSLITAIGVSMLLQNLALLIFGAASKPFPTVLNVPPLRFSGIQISFVTVLTIVVSVLLMALLQGFVKTSRAGKAMRAASEDYKTAQLMGINVNRTRFWNVALAGAIAGRPQASIFVRIARAVSLADSPLS